MPNIDCPHCQALLHADELPEGCAFLCPICQGRFLPPAAAPQPIRAVPVAGKPAQPVRAIPMQPRPTPQPLRAAPVAPRRRTRELERDDSEFRITPEGKKIAAIVVVAAVGLLTLLWAIGYVKRQFAPQDEPTAERRSGALFAPTKAANRERQLVDV